MPEAPTWAAALGRIPSGLFVVTVAHASDETGMLASWVQQCSFDPPTVSVAVKNGRYVLDWLTDGTEFAVNVLPEGEKKLVAHFGKGFEPGEPAFTGIEADRSGGVIVLPAALAHVKCRVIGRLDGGDHALVLGQVIGGAVAKPDGKPAVHTRKSGLHY
jgi:flavin reductase (DIM6/NTAB) family NADH-FMN oxidoreductase RutF